MSKAQWYARGLQECREKEWTGGDMKKKEITWTWTKTKMDIRDNLRTAKESYI